MSAAYGLAALLWGGSIVSIGVLGLLSGLSPTLRKWLVGEA